MKTSKIVLVVFLIVLVLGVTFVFSAGIASAATIGSKPSSSTGGCASPSDWNDAGAFIEYNKCLT